MHWVHNLNIALYSFISCIEENSDSGGAQMFNLTETATPRHKNLLSAAPNVTSATLPCENSAK